MNFIARTFVLSSLLVLTVQLTAHGQKVERPYQGELEVVVTGVSYPAADQMLIEGLLIGRATHMGQFHGIVEYLVDTTTGHFMGHVGRVTANGDELYESVVGGLTESGSMGTTTFTGGTGRFKNASGESVFVGTWTEPGVATVQFEGTISYDASDRRR